jgi:Multiubiquitin
MPETIMATEQTVNEGHGSAGAKHVQNCGSAPKWAVLVGDRLFPMPRRKLTARVILDQSEHGSDVVLVRDHGGVQDVTFDGDAGVDLAEGNVFRTVPRCDAKPNTHCTEPAKLAFVCDDELEVTLISQQTGKALKRLLRLPADAVLLRDYESPNDQPIGDDERVEFHDGPVFTCRGNGSGHGIKIIVNGRDKTVEAKRISYADLVILAFGAIQRDTIYTINYKHGPPSNPEGHMVSGDVVKLQCGMVFNVTDSGKS